ncbi:MAG: hypothetical protein ACXVHP_08580 [Methanobacterium sp.]
MDSKYIIGIIVAIIVIVGAYLVLAGGSNQTTINVAGSTSVQPVAEKLAQAYMQKNPGVKINGVTPSEQTVSDGTYKITRPFIFLTKGDPKGDVKKFLWCHLN